MVPSPDVSQERSDRSYSPAAPPKVVEALPPFPVSAMYSPPEALVAGAFP